MITAGVENELKTGDLVLYKDFTEDDWKIGVYAEYNNDPHTKFKHNIVIGIASDDEGNPDTENLMTLHYRYAVKFNIKNLDMK